MLNLRGKLKNTSEEHKVLKNGKVLVIGRINVVKMILPTLIHKFDAIPIRIQIGIWTGTRQVDF